MRKFLSMVSIPRIRVSRSYYNVVGPANDNNLILLLASISSAFPLPFLGLGFGLVLFKRLPYSSASGSWPSVVGVPLGELDILGVSKEGRE